MIYRCFTCGLWTTEDSHFHHMKKHGVNLFPELIRLNDVTNKAVADNRRLTEEVKTLKARLRILT